MSKKNAFKSILIMLIMLLSFNCLFVLFFAIDAAVFDVQNVNFTTVYGYFLYPLFSVFYGIISFKLTNRVILNNIPLLVFCGLFVVAFIDLGGYFHANAPIVGLGALLSVFAAFIISVIASVSFKLMKRCDDEQS